MLLGESVCGEIGVVMGFCGSDEEKKEVGQPVCCRESVGYIQLRKGMEEEEEEEE